MKKVIVALAWVLIAPLAFAQTNSNHKKQATITTTTTDGPVCIALAAPEELVTAADGAVDPVDKSVVVVEDEAALADGPDVLVLDTASCARNVDDHADRISIADKRADGLLISGIPIFS